MKAEELLERYAAGERDFSGAKLRRVNLSRADLSGVNLSGADLSWATLIETNLCGADLNGADLREASLRGADLTEANLRGAALRDVSLTGATLTGTNLDYASWPLHCDSLDAKIDERLAAQLFYHAYRAASAGGVDVSDPKALAEKFHRFAECGGWNVE